MFWLIFLLSAAAATPPHSSDEVLATVNGVAIRRSDLVKALDDRARQGYVDAADDLRDLEHSAVRDYLGRQAIEREAKETRTTPDAIYDRVLDADYERLDPNLLGGVVVRVGDSLFDGSIRTKLVQLRNQLLEKSSHEIQSRRDHFSSAS